MTNKCFLRKACKYINIEQLGRHHLETEMEHVFFFILRDEVSSPFSYMHANLKYILHTKKLMSHDTVSIFKAVFYDVVEIRFSKEKYGNLVLTLKNSIVLFENIPLLLEV